MKRIVVLVALLAMSVFLVAPAALAQGQVERGPEHANSICSFSGLNDEPDHPEEGGRVQSYGQIVGTLAKLGVHVNAEPGPAAPGIECNGHTHPYPEAFPPPAP
jgi:hypothetical protein